MVKFTAYSLGGMEGGKMSKKLWKHQQYAIDKYKDRPVLIIAPNALCQQWQDEIEANKEKEWDTLVCTSKTKNTVRFKRALDELCSVD